MNLNKEMEISKIISLLLSASPRALNVNDIAILLGDSHAHINRSLARLLREGKIKIETAEGGNYFTYAVESCTSSQDQFAQMMALN